MAWRPGPTLLSKFAWRMEDYNAKIIMLDLHLAGYSALPQEQPATQIRIPWCARQKLPFPGSLMTILSVAVTMLLLLHVIHFSLWVTIQG